jgi:hypothetical protein
MNATQHHIRKNKRSRRTKAKGIAPKNRRIYGVDETRKGCFGNPKRQTEICADKTTSNDFLKTTFLPKLKENEIVRSSTKPKNKREIQKMEKDFSQSLSLLSEHYEITPMNTQKFEFPYNISLSIWDTEKQLKNEVENWENIGLIQEKNKTFLTCTERYNTGMSLFYIPIIPLYKLLKISEKIKNENRNRKKSAELLLSVCCYLYRNAGIPYYRDEDFWMYEMLNDWVESDDETQETELQKKELKQAKIIGKLMFKKIANRQNLTFFAQRLKSFKPENDFDRNCFLLASKVFQLYVDFPEESIFRNAHFNNVHDLKNPDDDEYYSDDNVITMDKYISFSADSKGFIYHNLVESINTEFNEYGDIQEPIITKIFNGKNIIHKNFDFENRLFDVLNELITLLDFERKK